MKKHLLFLFAIFFVAEGRSQIVFCPPGAEWHYNFGQGATHLVNRKITYSGDSIIGADTFKVLSHTRDHILNCSPLEEFRTLIKQNGDTVFFRNSHTQNTWQILYNFAAQPGQGWSTTVLNWDNSSETFYTLIDSVAYVTVNNMSLKRMYSYEGYITERIGWNNFLFNFMDTSCDLGELIAGIGILCYKDEEFGLKQFTARDCDFEGYVGINNYQLQDFFKIYPNPVSERLTLAFQQQNNSGYEIRLVNVLGKEVLSRSTERSEDKLELNVSVLEAGVYFLQVFEKGKHVGTEKIIKE